MIHHSGTIIRTADIPVTVLLALCIAGGACGCGSSGEIVNMGAEERFAAGKQLFDEEDYLEAIAEFEIVKCSSRERGGDGPVSLGNRISTGSISRHRISGR